MVDLDCSLRTHEVKRWGRGNVSEFQVRLKYRIKKTPQKRMKGKKERKKEGEWEEEERGGGTQKETNVELERQGEPKSLQTTGNQEVIK